MSSMLPISFIYHVNHVIISYMSPMDVIHLNNCHPPTLSLQLLSAPHVTPLPPPSYIPSVPYHLCHRICIPMHIENFTPSYLSSFILNIFHPILSYLLINPFQLAINPFQLGIQTKSNIFTLLFVPYYYSLQKRTEKEQIRIDKQDKHCTAGGWGSSFPCSTLKAHSLLP